MVILVPTALNGISVGVSVGCRGVGVAVGGGGSLLQALSIKAAIMKAKAGGLNLRDDIEILLDDFYFI